MKAIFVVSLTFILFTVPALAGLTYLPFALDPDTAKVIVVVHGCLQSSESMAMGTGWNKIADANNLVVIYPQVPTGSNPMDCWGWYAPENQRADSGQLKLIKNEVDQQLRLVKLKNPKIFAVGISSGAATVAGLLACYPKYFTGGGFHSGLSYGLARNATEGLYVQVRGPDVAKKYTNPCSPSRFQGGGVFVIHGKDDKKVNTKHTVRIFKDFLTANPEEKKVVKSENGLKYEQTDFKIGGQLKGRLLMVEGLGHNWSGLQPHRRLSKGLKGVVVETVLDVKLPFFVEEGPDATQHMWNFFSQL